MAGSRRRVLPRLHCVRQRSLTRGGSTQFLRCAPRRKREWPQLGAAPLPSLCDADESSIASPLSALSQLKTRTRHPQRVRPPSLNRRPVAHFHSDPVPKSPVQIPSSQLMRSRISYRDRTLSIPAVLLRLRILRKWTKKGTDLGGLSL